MDAIGALVVFAVIPLAVTLVVVGFVLGPGWSRAGRWRPGEPWRDEPVLLTSETPEASGDVAEPPPVEAAELVPANPTPDSSDATAQVVPVAEAATAEYGGARGRW